MTQHAPGTFEVKCSPRRRRCRRGSSLGRISLEKRFSGDLEASGKGEMLAARSDVPTSAAYVAIERVTAACTGTKAVSPWCTRA